MNIPSHVDVDEPSFPPTNKTDVDTNVQGIQESASSLSVVMRDDLLANVDATSDEAVLFNTHYDVVICGTGLLQSILASALARYASNRYKILHVDHADHYGNLDAVYTYSYLRSKYEPSLRSEPMNDIYNDVTADNEFHVDNERILTVPLHPKGELQTLLFHKAERTKHHCYIRLHRTVQTPFGIGTVHSLLSKQQVSDDDSKWYHTLVIELNNWTLANRTRPKLYVGGIPSSMILNDTMNDVNEWYITNDQYIWDTYHIRTVSSYHASLILDTYSRSLALDITPYLIYAAGPAVDGLLTSTVSNYIEFKSLDAVLYYTPPPPQNNNNDAKSTVSHVGKFTRVPCSKKDVFASQLLSPLDKRRLMKFLHLALDYAGANANDDESANNDVHDTEKVETTDQAVGTATGNDVANELQSWNERYLNQGRSLIRPQNKVVATTELQHLQKLCHQKHQEQKSFLSYLHDDQQLKASPSLVALIRYALALDTNSENSNGTDDSSSNATTVQEGMEQLCAHMFALGRFGTTAFLVPLYGSGELSQAFCRSAAVYGTTYLLRRSPTALILQRNGNDDLYTVCGVHLSIPEESDNDHDESSPVSLTTTTKRISCTHVVVPEESLRYPNVMIQTSPTKRVLRRISIVTGKPIQIDQSSSPQQQQQQRHVLIMPPKSISKEQSSAIHGVIIDESVNVTPNIPGGCTIIHLTTILDHDYKINSDDDAEIGVDDRILSEAMNVVLQSFHTQSKDEDVAEIFHASFSYALPSHGENEPTKDVVDIRNSDGLHVVRRPPPSLTVDAIFNEATKVFLQICPDATKDDFLKLSQATTEAIQASLGPNIFNNEEEDDEITALNSALDMIEHPKA